MKSHSPSPERGSTLVAILLILCALSGLTAAGLSAATSSLRLSANFRTGLQALLAAETGLLHAAKTLDGRGVIRFDTEIVSLWSSVFGTTTRPMPIDSGITYSVAAAAHAVDPIQRMLLTSAGAARGGAQREVKAELRLDGAFSPGAVFLPATTIHATFNGNGLTIDGRDHRLGGGLNPEGEDRPGIGVLHASNAAAVTSALNSTQSDNVVGLGGSPSVLPADGPSSSRITNELVPNILSRPGVVTNPTIKGSDVFGTVAAPQITYFSGSATITGTTTGAGILIVDSALKISGNMNFIGLIIVRGTTEITEVQGNVAVLGAIWTTHVDLKVAGSASIAYSSEALEKVANYPFGGNVLPQGVAIDSWIES